MRVNIYCVLLACVLGWNVTAGLTHQVVQEKQQVKIRCPYKLTGDVLWSRESEGRKVDILTAGGDRNIKHINDPGRRYDSEADRSLFIIRANLSDSGRYLCNNTPAVELTVIPSGTEKLSVTERSNITLKCPPDVGGSGVPTWSRDSGEIQQDGRISVSHTDKTLIIREAQPADSGQYYCDGKPAVYLNVTKGERSDRDVPSDGQLVLILGVIILVLIIIITFIILFMTWRRRYKRKENCEQRVYAEINETEQAGSKPDDPTYSVIHHPPTGGSTTAPSQSNMTVYTLTCEH